MQLVIDRVTKRYKQKTAVSAFTAELSEGVHALLGPNGSGKTSLMRMLADILRPTEGRILVDGQDISAMGDGYRDLLGYLPQDFGVYKNFTAERFLQYFAGLKGLPKWEAKAKVDEVLELVRLSDVRKQKAASFSGGMKQRLGIAQALLNDPKILVVDEPTAGLDPKERIRFRNLLAEIASDRIVILSTHIVPDIEYIAKKVMLIRSGQLIGFGTPFDLLEEMKGRVWQATVPETAFPALQAVHKIGSVTRQADGVTVRILAPTIPLPGAEAVQPNLEDLYLHYFE